MARLFVFPIDFKHRIYNLLLMMSSVTQLAMIDEELISIVTVGCMVLWHPVINSHDGK